MILVEPMPHELAIAHAGRIAWGNGCADRSEFDMLGYSTPKGTVEVSVARPRLNQLASLCGMSETDYARQHSMLSAFRVAAKASEDHLHGDVGGDTFTRRLGMLTQRPGAYLCTQCVIEDLDHWHFSWFRRSHHLLGVDWCPSHRIPLSRVTAKDPWASTPMYWVEKGEVETLQTSCACLDEAGFLARFVDIASALLEKARPFEARVINSAISQRVKFQGLRTSAQGVRPLLSDHVKVIAPAGWLEQHLPELGQKKAGEFHAWLDALAISRTVPGTGFAYAVAMSALFDTAEAAMLYLNQEAVPCRALDSDKDNKQMRRSRAFWHGEFWGIYQEFGGRPALIAQRLNMDRTYVAEKMHHMGLPALYDAATASRWRAFVRFQNGESLAAACEIERVDVAVVEALLRTTSARVVPVVKALIEGHDGPRGGSDGLNALASQRPASSPVYVREEISTQV
ncbi:MAG: TniQ family protein [Burkholderiales bacterium]|nr:TniQ family protein [Burkholderiales bacterium]